MKFTILSVKKRNILARLFSSDTWQIRVRLENGQEMTLNCWAGLGKPRESWLIDDLKKRIGEKSNHHKTLRLRNTS